MGQKQFVALLSDEKAEQGKNRPITRLDKAFDGVYYFVNQLGTVNANADRNWVGTNGLIVRRHEAPASEKPVTFWAMMLIGANGVADKADFIDPQGNYRQDVKVIVTKGEIVKVSHIKAETVAKLSGEKVFAEAEE